MKLITWKGTLQLKDCPRNEVRMANVDEIIAWIVEHDEWDAIKDWAPIKF